MTKQHQPRRLGAISTVYQDLRNSAHQFKSEMLRLESELPDEFDFGSGLVTAETIPIVEKKRECKMYSRLIQEFALLAVEAFLNAYGYVRFGQEEEFEPKSDRFSIPQLAQMVCEPSVQTFQNDCESADVVKRLASCRNRLVQLRSALHVAGDGTRFEKTDDSQSAVAAVQEMERFFELFAQIDPYLGTISEAS